MGLAGADVMSVRTSFKALCLVGPAVSLAACAGAPDEADTDEDVANLGARSVEITDFLRGEDRTRWTVMTAKLRQSFDQVCGDRYCTGEFPNLRSLTFTCAVSPKLGKIQECIWTFAGSKDWVFGSTGSARSSVAAFECRMKPSGRAKDLVKAFADDPITSVLPGLEGTLYEQLGDCLVDPISYVPPPEVIDGPDYVSVLDTVEGETREAYDAMTEGLEKAFTQTCAGTRCDGEWPHRASLRFNCSERVSDGQLGSCTWTIAANQIGYNAREGIFAVLNGAMCDVPVTGTLADLTQALAPVDTGTPLLERPLPGTGVTLSSALADCFAPAPTE